MWNHWLDYGQNRDPLKKGTVKCLRLPTSQFEWDSKRLKDSKASPVALLDTFTWTKGPHPNCKKQPQYLKLFQGQMGCVISQHALGLLHGLLVPVPGTPQQLWVNHSCPPKFPTISNMSDFTFGKKRSSSKHWLWIIYSWRNKQIQNIYVKLSNSAEKVFCFLQYCLRGNLRDKKAFKRLKKKKWLSNRVKKKSCKIWLAFRWALAQRSVDLARESLACL